MFKKLTFTIAALLAAMTLMAAVQKAGLNVDNRTRYQHVTGFGGFSPSPQWSYWLGNDEMDMLFGKGENQLGLNILRLYMANNRSYWNSGIANAKRAKKYGAFIFASPWSPPAAWKSNNSETNGGSLLESRYADWAKLLNDYYKYMKAQGARIDAVSIQNEPDWNTSYQSCIWTGDQLAKFLREQGAKIECKVIAPEAVHFTRSMHEPILNDEVACEHLDILGGHFYGWDGSSYPLAEQKGKEVWMTEYLINERQEKEGKNIDWQTDGFLFARSINDAMLANMSAWVHYSLKRYYGCLGDGQYGTVNNQITKRGYVLSQYAKYVAGTTRVRHSLDDATGKLSSSAYITESEDSVVVMVINPSADTYATTLTLPFYTLGGTAVTTSATLNAKKTTMVEADETYAPEVAVAPYSVNTYIFRKSSKRTDIPEEPLGTETVFTDEFALSGAECVPAGWRSQSESGLRYEGNYSLGPRVMSFSAEGAMQYAFYFRSGGNASGYVSYGEEADHRLYLKPGKYTLSYSVEGWKATPSLTCAVLPVSGSSLNSQKCVPTEYVSGNGSEVRIINPTECSLDVEIKSAGSYILRWGTAKATSGYSELLVGNIKLVRHPDTPAGIESVNTTTENIMGDNVIYNLNGQRVTTPRRGGVYIVNGRKKVW